jgi:hypothetical protein
MGTEPPGCCTVIICTESWEELTQETQGVSRLGQRCHLSCYLATHVTRHTSHVTRHTHSLCLTVNAMTYSSLIYCPLIHMTYCPLIKVTHFKVTHCPRINMGYYPLIKRSQHPSLTTTKGPRESDSATAWAVVASRSTALRTPLLMPLCPLYTCLTPLTRTHTSKHASGMETLLQCDVETLFQCHIDVETLFQTTREGRGDTRK